MDRAFRFFELQHCLDQEKRPLSESAAHNPYGVAFNDQLGRRAGRNGEPTYFNRSALEQAIAHWPAVQGLMTDISQWVSKNQGEPVIDLKQAWQICSISRWLAFYLLEVCRWDDVPAEVGVLYKATRGLHTAISHAVLNGCQPSDLLHSDKILSLVKEQNLLVREQRSCAAPDSFILSVLDYLAAPSSATQSDLLNSISFEQLALYADTHENLEFACSWLVEMAAQGAAPVAEFTETSQTDLATRALLWGQHSPIGIFFAKYPASHLSDKEEILVRYGQLGLHGPMAEGHICELARQCLHTGCQEDQPLTSIEAFVSALGTKSVMTHA